jgi:hypothetical protein
MIRVLSYLIIYKTCKYTRQRALGADCCTFIARCKHSLANPPLAGKEDGSSFQRWRSGKSDIFATSLSLWGSINRKEI